MLIWCDQFNVINLDIVNIYCLNMILKHNVNVHFILFFRDTNIYFTYIWVIHAPVSNSYLTAI